jgi:hypothetical protein
MNFSSILSEIEKLDPEVYERTSMRRSVIKNFTRKVSLTALPFAIGSLFNKAYGKTADVVADALNLALTLEYLERDFYKMAIEKTMVTPPANQLIPSVTGLELPAFKKIYQHEVNHVIFLQQVIQGLQQPFAFGPTFDFTGGKGTGSGPFVNVFSDYGVFLALAQTFEDLGVRTYKSAVPVLKSKNDLLTAAMRIHSVEARHAAHIRMMRARTAGPLSDNQTINPWITMDQSAINSPDFQAAYDGEQNTTQITFEVKNINAQPITEDVATEAFDEPIAIEKVMEFASNFIAP